MDKLNENDLIYKSVDKKMALNTEYDIKLNALQGAERIERTKIVLEYLKAIKNIESKIIEAIALDKSCIVLHTEIIPGSANELWQKLPSLNRDDIVYTPLGNQDLDFSLVDIVDTSQSIIQMIEAIVPNDYRVLGMYVVS